MSCDNVQAQLTGYLDGDLEGDRGTLVRGHLRTCATCRDVASRESVLRDGLRELPTVDPPPEMWAQVQARLAVAEVADSQRPAWRRAVARWMPSVPRLATAGALAAAAVTILWWRTHRNDEPQRTLDPVIAVQAPVHARESMPNPPALPVTSACEPSVPVPQAGDVSSDLALDAQRVTASYCAAVEDLLVRSREVRAAWSGDRRNEFETTFVQMQHAVDQAEIGRPRQRALRSLVRFVEGAVIRDQIALAGGGG